LQFGLPESIQSLLDRGVLRRIDDSEFVIDALRHRERTYLGWSIVIYRLLIEENDDGSPRYEIEEETESLGHDTIVCSKSLQQNY
jgi:hypothetical protein